MSAQQHILEILGEQDVSHGLDLSMLPNGLSCEISNIEHYEDDYSEIIAGFRELHCFEFSQYSIFIDFAAKNYSNMPELPKEIDKLIPLWGKLESYPFKEQLLALVDGMNFEMAYQILSGYEG